MDALGEVSAGRDVGSVDRSTIRRRRASRSGSVASPLCPMSGSPWLGGPLSVSWDPGSRPGAEGAAVTLMAGPVQVVHRLGGNPPRSTRRIGRAGNRRLQARGVRRCALIVRKDLVGGAVDRSAIG